MQLSSSVRDVKGVGEKTVPKLNKLNIYTIRDLIYDLPKGFMDISEPTEVSEDNIGRLIAVRGVCVKNSVYTVKKGKTMTFAKVKTAQNTMNLVYFNAPYIKNSFDFNEEKIYYGVLTNNKGFLMTQPKIYTIAEYEMMLDVLQPVYALTKGLSNVQLRKYIKNAFDVVTLPGEYLDDEVLQKYGMPHFQKAMLDIHFPTSLEEHKLARKRLAFHEFLTFLLETSAEAAYVKRPFNKTIIETADCGRLIEALPYRLTDAQLRAWGEIKDDMCGDTCMNRMLQGDVGSGKTIVAFLALLLNASNNHQGCLMAPTEVLATQHYEGLNKLIEEYHLPIKPILLTGSVTGKARREAYEKIETGYANVIIGTHALIQESVKYHDVTLIITDEQHRFGVRQREAIAQDNTDVHVLVMSATPIPRSLAMTLYAGISFSVIDELPADRLPIKNCVIGRGSVPTAYKFIMDEVHKGHQVYVICPLVEATEGSEGLENVIDYSERLASVLPPDIRIDYLHGKMKATAKNAIMNEFAARNIDVLVSTTVIEVGINVPNATVMMVENADRFGLAALHQLRGRVGRGDAQSYCIFVNTSDSDVAAKRMDILAKSNDGFYIASEDLKMRGPGELTGIRQSGDFGFQIADIYDDAAALSDAKDYYDDLVAANDEANLNNLSKSLDEFGFYPVDFRTI